MHLVLSRLQCWMCSSKKAFIDSLLLIISIFWIISMTTMIWISAWDERLMSRTRVLKILRFRSATFEIAVQMMKEDPKMRKMNPTESFSPSSRILDEDRGLTAWITPQTATQNWKVSQIMTQEKTRWLKRCA